MPEEAAVRFRRWFPVSKVGQISMELGVHDKACTICWYSSGKLLLTRHWGPISKCALQWSAETNATITALFFKWLVGPLETKDVEVDFEGKKQTWRSGVQIKKCRCIPWLSVYYDAEHQKMIAPAVSQPLRHIEKESYSSIHPCPAGIWSKVDVWACA